MHRKICFLLCLFLLPFLMLSCGEKKDFLEILDGDFVCRAEGTVGGKPFSATLYASGRVIYDAPSELCGIIASEDGKTLTLDGMSLTAEALVGFFVPARLLTDEFEVSGVGTEKGSECYVDCVNAHGDRRVYVSADGTPRRVTGSFGGISADFEIVDFEKNGENGWGELFKKFPPTVLLFYSKLLKSTSISSTLVSLGLPGRQASA